MTTPPGSAIPASPPRPRHALLRPLYHPQSLDLLDPGALCLYFAGPNSHTGEDVLELHLHGGPAIIRAVLAAIPSCSSSPAHKIRYAEAGEFTRQAFYNNRLLLPEIEALGETLDAATEEQRKRVVRGGAGLSRVYEEWRRELVEARGELEALIDFAEDQHFLESNAELIRGVAVRAEWLRDTMRVHVQNAARGELLRGGISLSLVGAPNAGKSSLLNRVVGREAVIVSEEAGTTRDVVDLAVDVGGFMVVLGDTAGLRVEDVGVRVGKIEEEGIRRARERAMAADVVVAVVDIFNVDPPAVRLSQELIHLVNKVEGAGKQVVIAVNKIDLLKDSALPMDLLRQINNAFPSVKESHIFGISCVPAADSDKGDGIQKLLEGLMRVFKDMTSPLTGKGGQEMADSIGATERQRWLVEACIVFLDDFLEMVKRGEKGTNTKEVEDEDGEGDLDVVVAAEELRGAAECLGRITGRGELVGDVEDVLGVVFEKFCVGK